MLLNIAVGFLIPWIFGAYLYRKDKRFLLLIGPLASVFTFILIDLGELFRVWNLYPFEMDNSIAAIPFCLGIYPINASYMIYLIHAKKIPQYGAILIFSIVTTIEEGLGLIVGRVIYDKGWNISWTFISYLIPYLICYYYYFVLFKEKIAFIEEKEK